MNGNSADQPSADARESQFSLRTLFIGVTVCCVVLSIASYSHQRWFAAAVAFALFLAALVTLFAAAYWRKPGLVLACCIILAVMFLVPAQQSNYGPSPRTMCCNNLKNLTCALQNYHAFYGQLPPAIIRDEKGSPMHSWRVLLLPFMELNNVYVQYDFNEPWNGPNNSKLGTDPRIARLFRCPAETKKSGAALLETNYVAVIGKQTAWPGDAPLDIDSVIDGVDETLSIVEVKNSGIHWMEPRDLDFQTLTLRINPPGTTVGLSSPHHDGCHASCCDGHVVYLPNDTPPATLRAFLTRDGGEDKKLLAKWRRY